VTPYYQQDGITIYHGDCIEVVSSLQAASVDLLVTDPPYCSGGSLEAQKNTSAQGLRTKTVQAEDFEWFAADNMSTAGLVSLLRSVLVRSRRVLRPNSGAFVFCDWRMVPALAPALESSGLRYRNMLVWDKGSAGLGCGFKPAHEIVLEYSNGVTEYFSRTGQNVLRYRRVSSAVKEHGAQKPAPLIAEILSVAAPEGGVVLDPFMGSGSTLIAAQITGRRAIGCELDERNCEIAAKRLSQGSLFVADTPAILPSSGGLFSESTTETDGQTL
jgi:DNA modification methylase